MYKALLQNGLSTIQPLSNWKRIVRSVENEPCVKTFVRVLENGSESPDPRMAPNGYVINSAHVSLIQ